MSDRKSILWTTEEGLVVSVGRMETPQIINSIRICGQMFSENPLRMVNGRLVDEWVDIFEDELVERMKKMQSLTLNEYSDLALKHAFYPRSPLFFLEEEDGESKSVPLYPFMKITGEAGELIEKVAKTMRDRGQKGHLLNKADVAAELGDILWYVAACAREIGFTLEDVARANIEKLDSRAERGKLSGSGDNR